MQDLRAVLDELGIEQANLVGCSQGGRFSVDFALAYPKRVSKLVLVAPAIGGAPQPEELPDDIDNLLQQAEQAEDQKHYDLVNRIEAHMWLDGPRSADGRVPGSPRDLFLRMNIIPLKSPSPGKDEAAKDSFKRLKEIVAPTLLIWGDLDFPHLQERCALLGKRIKGAQVRDDAGHRAFAEPGAAEKVQRAAGCVLEGGAVGVPLATPLVMVVLGTTIHEFACERRDVPSKLVDGRTKSDHDVRECGDATPPPAPVRSRRSRGRSYRPAYR